MFNYCDLVIKTMSSHPHLRNIKRTDVVSRHKQYRTSWSAQKAPGEDRHHSLRWNVREQCLYHDEVVEKVGIFEFFRSQQGS